MPHTTGPWIDGGCMIFAQGTDPARDDQHLLLAVMDPGGDRSRDDVEADCRIMAAAPDLLAACESWMDYEGKSCLLLGVDGWCGECNRCVTRDAIAKAKGRA